MAMNRKRILPPLGVVLPRAFIAVVPGIVLRDLHCSVVRLQVRVVLEMCHIASGVAALQKGVRSRALLFALPEKVLA
jgi:hypothetical protein